MADLVIYNDGELELNIPINNETVWLNRNQISELLGIDVKTIGKHINNVFSDDELDQPSAIANFATTEADGKRNINRFPEKFRFQLTEQEKHEPVANCDRFNTLKHSTSLPFAFTEQGVSMLSAVLKSDTAIKMSIQIINTFVGMRKFAEAWSDEEVVQRTVALIPWRSNITLLDKLTEPELRLWYAKKTVEYAFGKDMLVIQIETKLHQREGDREVARAAYKFVTQVLFISLINIKEYCNYTVANTPFPPLNNVPKRGSSF